MTALSQQQPNIIIDGRPAQGRPPPFSAHNKTLQLNIVGGRLRDYTVGLHSEPKIIELIKFLYVDKQFPDNFQSSNLAL